MPINFTITNKQNFPGMGGQTPILDGSESNPNRVESVYGNANFSFRINFSATDIDENPVSILSCNCTNIPDYIDFEIFDNNSININKNSFSPYTEKYIFSKLLENGGVEITEDETSNDAFIIEWEPPSNKIINTSYTFEIEHETSISISTPIISTLIVPHRFYWDFTPSLEIFEGFVNR